MHFLHLQMIFGLLHQLAGDHKQDMLISNSDTILLLLTNSDADVFDIDNPV